MKKRIRRGGENADVNLTPMLDIVFIMLIFFIVTSTFLQEQGLQLISPQNEDQPENPQTAPSILVQIDRNSSIFINGRLTDPARVTAAVQRQNVDSGGRSAVVIQPDPDAEHGVVTGVFDSALAARVVGVVVREPEREPGG
jgi:biopolymer transport protein ExbD